MKSKRKKKCHIRGNFRVRLPGSRQIKGFFFFIYWKDVYQKPVTRSFQ